MNHTRLIVVAAGLMASTAFAQQPGIQLVVPPSTVEVGEVVTGQLVCTNIGNPSTPKMSAPKGVEVHLVSDSPYVSQQTMSINGRRSSRVTYTYNLRIVGTKAGTYSIGPISVEADGQTYTAPPVPFQVMESQAPTGPRGDQFLIVSLDVQPPKLYVTESYTATLTIGIRSVVLNGREYEIDMLRQVLDLSASEISIFGGGQATKSEQWLQDSSGARHKYEFYRVTRRMTAEQAGTIKVGPIFLKADYPTALRRGFFGRAEISRTRRETARADAAEVTVLDPPLDSRPADFTGAIGRYSMTASVKPDRVELGQPVTLTLTIKGSPLESVAGPALAKNAELTSRFDFSQDELVGDIENGAKVFRRAIFPRQAGEQTVPAISWSYFDTKREKYITLESKPIDIVVDPSSQSADGLAPLEMPKHKRDATKLTVVSGGISPNYVDANTVLADQSAALATPAAATALVVPPLLCLGVSFWWRRRLRLSRDAGFARARRAAAKAHAGIRRALAQPDAAAQLSEMAAALSAFVSDRFDMAQATPTASECAEFMQQRGIDEPTAGAVTDILERCEALRYAPSAADSLSPHETAERIRAWIKALDRGAR